MLIWRVLSAVVGIPLVVAAVVVGGPVLLLFVLILALLAAHEFITKCRAAGINVPGVIVYPVVFVAPTLAFAWTEPPLLPVLQGAITLSGGEMALALLATMLYRHRLTPVRDRPGTTETRASRWFAMGATALGLYIAIPWSSWCSSDILCWSCCRGGAAARDGRETASCSWSPGRRTSPLLWGARSGSGSSRRSAPTRPSRAVGGLWGNSRGDARAWFWASVILHGLPRCFCVMGRWATWRSPS